MIFYNVGQQFFELKNDADVYRRQHGLPKNKLHKLSISNREEMVTFLNQICDPANEATPTPVTCEAKGDWPDWIPKFITEGWEKRRKMGASA